MRDRIQEIRTVADLRVAENRPSGLSKEERGRLMDLWNTIKLTKEERREMFALQAQMR